MFNYFLLSTTLNFLKNYLKYLNKKIIKFYENFSEKQLKTQVKMKK